MNCPYNRAYAIRPYVHIRFAFHFKLFTFCQVLIPVTCLSAEALAKVGHLTPSLQLSNCLLFLF